MDTYLYGISISIIIILTCMEKRNVSNKKIREILINFLCLLNMGN